VAVVEPLPAGLFERPDGGFLADWSSEDLVYFLVNVGDGDTQLVLLPARAGQPRRCLVVDVLAADKLAALVRALVDAGRLELHPQLFAIVVATHPHQDHIGGMPRFLDVFENQIDELWEPGFYHASSAYLEMMRALEDNDVRHTQPTSGMTRFLNTVKVTVLSPGVVLRNRFDSYGVDINNASVSLKLDFPATRLEQVDEDRRLRAPSPQSLLLGADAQTMSWSQVMVDFPQLGPDPTPANQALGKARGYVPLRAKVFKVPHHGSKHGVSLELMEAVQPSLTLISSVAGGGKYEFPHLVAVEGIREAIEPIASRPAGVRTSKDWELGVHYTGAGDDTGAPLGTIALVMSPTGRKRHLWRFGDGADDRIDLASGRRFTGRT
jgi:hypothetical protein